jgi:hypothetical protein
MRRAMDRRNRSVSEANARSERGRAATSVTDGPTDGVRVAGLALALLIVAGQASAQELPRAVRAAGDRITADQLRRDLETLAQDAWNGRASLSPGLDSAAAFVIGRLQRAGLTPFGDSGTFRQHYAVREAIPDTANRYVEVAGRRFTAADIVDLGFLGARTIAAASVVYAGHGWRIPSLGIDPYAGLDLAGKIVLVNANAIPPGMSGRPPAGALPPTRAALDAGAVAVVQVPSAAQVEQWTQLLARPVRYRELEPAVPSAYAARGRASAPLLHPRVIDALLEGTGHTAASLALAATRGEFPPAFVINRALRLHLPAAVDHLRDGYNVVARLEGSDPVLRNEVVTVFAHLDGAVGSTPETGWNAADDNATGSAGILRIAEELARRGVPRPRRSVVFVWDSGEEVGLWGSRSFVGRPVVPLDRIAAHFNIDMIGGTRAPGRADSAEAELTRPNETWLIGPRGLASDLDSLLHQVNRGYVNMTFDQSHDREGDQFFYPRTDAGPFLERGIPTIGFFTGMHERYHRPSDEAQYLDPVKMEQVSRTVLASVWMVADMPRRPRFTIPASVPRYGPMVP